MKLTPQQEKNIKIGAAVFIGLCIFGVVLYIIFRGTTNKKCPGNCSGHGKCSKLTGKCSCNSPYYGKDCSLMKCPNDCSGNGECDGSSGTCSCNDKWSGPACSQIFKSCTPPNCSGNGTCNNMTGTCTCTGGYTGTGCETAPTAGWLKWLEEWGGKLMSLFSASCPAFDPKNPGPFWVELAAALQASGITVPKSWTEVMADLGKIREIFNKVCVKTPPAGFSTGYDNDYRYSYYGNPVQDKNNSVIGVGR